MARIVATAQRVNSVQGITGLLVWGGGMFSAWLYKRLQGSVTLNQAGFGR